LTNAVLRLQTACGQCMLTPFLQAGTGWVQPSAAIASPQVSYHGDRMHFECVYAVPDDRQFTVEVDVYPGISALFLGSRLRSISRTRGEYYFWQTNASAREYAFPGARGAETGSFDLHGSSQLDWKEWLFLKPPEESGIVPTGGLVILPTNDVGRSAGEGGCIYLHALPRSNVLGPGDSLDASFGIAGAKDAATAARLSAAARAAHVPALEPWLHRPAATRPATSPAPRWLREAGTYNLYYQSASRWTGEIVQERLRHCPFIIGSTPDKAALDKCHQAKVRLLHYVICTCLLETDMQVRGGGRVYSEWKESIDNESRDLKNHPDWVCIQADGGIRHDPWGQQHGHPGLLNTCLSQPGLREAAIRQVRMLMDMGFDGVFIDLAGPLEECYGPKFGKHTHPVAGQTHTQAYESLLREIHATVKSYGSDRIFIQNTCTFMLPSRWAYADAQMLEAFPFGNESTRMLASWPEMQWVAAVHGQAASRGSAPVILAYFNKFSAATVREPALFSYAYARIHGFLWADSFTLADIPGNQEFASNLYQARLGNAVGEVGLTGPAVYRRFEHGMAVLNPTPSTIDALIPVAHTTPLIDVGYARTAIPMGGHLDLRLPPMSGRVLLMRPATSGPQNGTP